MPLEEAGRGGREKLLGVPSQGVSPGITLTALSYVLVLTDSPVLYPLFQDRLLPFTACLGCVLGRSTWRQPAPASGQDLPVGIIIHVVVIRQPPRPVKQEGLSTRLLCVLLCDPGKVTKSL